MRQTLRGKHYYAHFINEKTGTERFVSGLFSGSLFLSLVLPFLQSFLHKNSDCAWLFTLFFLLSHLSSVILLAYSTMLGFATSNPNLALSGITWFVCFLTFCFFSEGKLLKGMAFALLSAVFLAPSMCLAHRGVPSRHLVAWMDCKDSSTF